jgi:acetyl-CoA carboxylase carboxyltransferase component
MSWEREVEQIRERERRALELGGAEAVARQHERGRLSVRERIDALCDRGSFREYGSVSGTSETDDEGNLKSFTPANAVVGVAQIDGRRVVVCGDDFTLRGAAYSPAGMKKAMYAERLALQRRVPLLRLLEAGGASIKGATQTKGRSGYDWTDTSPMNMACIEALASIPVVCAALGPTAGFPAARLVAAHFAIMTRDTAQVITGGPKLVERATGEKLTKEELGGAQVHERSGVVDAVAEDEADVWRQARKFLSYLPSNVWAHTPLDRTGDPRERREQKLISLVPRSRRRAYKMRRILEAVVDRASLFELTPGYGRSQITALARVDGRAVGIIANDLYFDGGSMTADGAQKIRRFVELCDMFHLPILSFVDEPGFNIGSQAEREATIRHGMNALFAVLQTKVPWFCVIVRRSFGVAAGVHLGPNATVAAWPSAEAGALPLEAGVELAFGREIAAAPDPEVRRRELEEEMAEAQSIFPRAEEFGAHHLIDPRDTRPLICDWLDEVEHQVAGLLGPRSYSIRP